MKKCRICNCESLESLTVEEKQFGTGHKFLYLKCQNCGCLQISQYVKNIGDYYGSSYYAFSQRTVNKSKFHNVKNLLIGCLYKYHFTKNKYCNVFGYLLSFKYGKGLLYEKVIGDNTDFSETILDIGCGNGDLLKKMKLAGYDKLTGVDLFIPPELYHVNESGIQMVKGTIFDLENEKFDFIMMNHSLEHMERQKEVLDKVCKLLEKNGILMIRIPLADSMAFTKYKENWFQLDAPRHYYLHTLKSMNILCNEVGLKIKSIQFDSEGRHLLGSELYEQGILLNKDYCLNHAIADKFHKKEQKRYESGAEKLNRSSQGDQAIFLIQKG